MFCPVLGNVGHGYYVDSDCREQTWQEKPEIEPTELDETK